eukprot:CAMPEP_0181322962 /NCGR_PEP_ID=MMETSP1101-20121128/19517_1 /TAXON_ID=46948 /ORGANISM="Rhodomonas abbreviata, Strain Caron Lab Isolate" /LENGTH=687 /DNA_ID=CAMNT_0023430929 /DNA_START=127 /DNA_END=2190 /DNA_ORIENTATION=+
MASNSSRKNQRRGLALALVALACCAAVGVVVVRHGMSKPDVLCDDITCMINSPAKPPGAISSVPRTLSDDEIAKLQAALQTEQGLQQQVETDMDQLAAESKVNILVKLSPKGPKGARGPPGYFGPIGDAGPPGPVGVMGAKGRDGDTGPKGNQGPAGPAGPKGEPGKQGPTGPPGQQGPTGLSGEAGPKGPTGGQGPQGPIGPEPPAGAAGPRGPAGAVGPAGPEGAQGLRGVAAPAPGVISSTVINPVTGGTLSGARIWAMRDGVELGSAMSASDGSYSFTVTPGATIIMCSMSGYMTFTTHTLILPRQVFGERMLLAPTLPEGAAGIVLVWNPAIPDMDIHMSTPWGCDVDWTNYYCIQPGGDGKAHLDRDDLNGGGPETMTIDHPAPGAFKVFVHRYSPGDIYLSEAIVYVFQSDGRIFRFSLENDDGTLEGDDLDIWNVCDIDGLTGNVIATDKSRRVLDFQEGTGVVAVSDFGNMPQSTLSAVFWMQSTAENMGSPMSYMTATQTNAFTIQNYKAFTVCVAGQCSPMTTVAATGGQWHHVAFTWDSSTGEAKIYLDGNEAWAALLATGLSIENDGTFMLGNVQTAVGVAGGANTHFQGAMSDVGLFNRVFAATDVQGAMMMHLIGNEAGGVLVFPMVQETDELDSLKDMSVTAAVGQFQGEPAPTLVIPGSEDWTGEKPPYF